MKSELKYIQCRKWAWTHQEILQYRFCITEWSNPFKHIVSLAEVSVNSDVSSCEKFYLVNILNSEILCQLVVSSIEVKYNVKFFETLSFM